MRAPLYEGGYVAPRALPTPYQSDAGASPEAFGAGLAAGLANVGADLARIGQEERDRADTGRVLDSAAAFDADALSLLHDPQNGAFARRGKDAVGVADLTLAELEKRRLAIRGGLRGERVRLVFDRQTVPQMLAHQRSLMEFEADQGHKVDLAAGESRIAAQQELAAASFGDPAAVRVALGNVRGAAAALSTLRGDDPETAARAQAEAVSSLHAGVARAMLDAGQAVEASAYLDANKDSLLADQESALRRAIAPMADSQRAYALSDGIWDRAGGSLEKAMGLVRAELASSPLRQDVEAILDHRSQQADEAARDADYSGFRDAYAAFAARRTTQDIPPALLASLSPERQEWFRDQMRQDATNRQHMAALSAEEKAARREEAQGISTRIWGLVGLQATEDPEGFRSADLIGDPALVGLTNEDRQDLIRRQIVAREAFRKGSQDASSEGAVADILVQTAVTAGLLSPKATGAERDADQEFVRYRRSFDRWVSSFRSKNGREPSAVEAQDEADRLATKVKVGSQSSWLAFGWPADVQGWAGTLTPEESATLEVPEADVARITARLRAAGAPTDEATVRAAYLYELGVR